MFQCFSSLPVYCKMPPAGEQLQCLDVISVCHLSTFLPPSKGRINIQNVFYSKVPSSRPMASRLLCSDCLYCQLQKTEVPLHLSKLLWYTTLWILINQIEPFQRYLTYMVFFQDINLVRWKHFIFKTLTSFGPRKQPCIRWMMMHFWYFPKGFGHVIPQLKSLKITNIQHTILFTTE